MNRLIFSLLLSSVFFFVGCKKAEERQLDKDIARIQEYLDDNGLTAQSTDSGLHYIIEEPGEGPQPNASSTVTVDYRGYYPSGNVFDQSSEAGISFNLSNVIEGWTEGIQLFKEGGKGTLFVPSGLAYGPEGNANIGGNAVLFFDIELLDVEE